jgi:HlyD family secretion protein
MKTPVMKTMMKTGRLWLVGVLPLAVLAAGPGPGAAQPAPAAARAVTVEGVVRSEGRVEIKSSLSVPIHRVAVREGQTVTRGDILIEMAHDLQRAHVDSASAEVGRAYSAVAEAEEMVRRAQSAVAEAELKLQIARRELDRNRSVADLITARELAMSADAVEQATASLRLRQAEVARAEAEVRTRRDEVRRAEAQAAVAWASLENTRILAPFDGIVSRIRLPVGATPRAAETTLLELLALDRLYVEVAVPLPLLASLRQGATAAVVIEAGHGALRTALPGKVSFIYPEVDTALRMARIKVEVDRVGLRVLPGMLARVTLHPERKGR